MSWWESFYDATFARHMLVEPHPGELDFLLQVLQAPPGARLFDQCCGVGRLAGPLSQRGYAVVGVDITSHYVDEAARLYPQATFVCGDAGRFVAEPTCAGGFNAYSSFGYSPSDEENRALLECAFRSLHPGARFVLDTINAARVIESFQSVMETEFPDGLRLRRESRIDWSQGMLKQNWVYEDPEGGVKTRQGDTRLYLPREVGDLLRQAGFEPEALYGDFQGGSFHSQSARLIWVARR